MSPVIALALGWKIGIAIASFLAGLAVAAGVAIVDMTQNFETGYGSKTKSREWISLAFFLAGIVGAVLIFFLGCTVDNPAAGNQVAYRDNETGELGKADRSTCVVHYYTDPPGIFHDCDPQRPGAALRTWQQLIIYVNGRPSRIFQEISIPQASAIYHFELHWLGLTPSGFWPAWPVEERGAWSTELGVAKNSSAPTLTHARPTSARLSVLNV
jgi:hypothetical protein